MSGGAFGTAAAAKQLNEGDKGEGASAEVNSGIGELCARMTAFRMSVEQSARKMAQDTGLAKKSHRQITAPVVQGSSQGDVMEEGEAGRVAGSEDGGDDLWGSCDAMDSVMRQPSRVIKTKRVRDDGRGRRRGGPVLAAIVQQGATSKEMDGNKSFEETPGSETGSKTWDSLTTLGS